MSQEDINSVIDEIKDRVIQTLFKVGIGIVIGMIFVSAIAFEAGIEAPRIINTWSAWTLYCLFGLALNKFWKE